ncbi:nose resistant to fluoxetine protein 6-like [Maniola hyperantus]|uniref:nose resistant to fluoxetine protein 6-like n=1 Tax=Aphantopus hyperantus TaxID=2795564 RepID=UPI001569DE22|nr:nose resistant to fluoxetine protein 6-like [Maniola hyperantus]
MMLLAILSLFLVEQSAAVIYRINATEYHRMPALFALDDFAECMLEPGGTYCVADYDLSSRGHSDLMHFIREYSSYKRKHFNHSKIHRGTCVSITCKDYFYELNKTRDLEDVLGECLNASLWKSHKLEASLSEIMYCKKADDETILDTSDFVVVGVYVFIIMINIIGSFYDIILCEKDSKTGNPYLLAFSLRRNWSRLTAPGGIGPDSRMERLKIFNGLRTMTIVCVIFSHCALLLSCAYVANPHYVEQTYDDLSKQILYNGSLVTHTFFIMSSFLLSYNLQIQAEKRDITWKQIPKGILLRWIRLTPPYALILATISTWMRHVGSGPQWDLVVTSESNYCRQYWWANIFYFNNYIYQQDLCFPQGWYLAADTQLFILALVVLVLVKKPQHRAAVLTLMFLASLAITAGHTYIQDLDAVVIQSPESYRSMYKNDDTYRLVYIRGHTNLSVYTLGLAGGLLVYWWQTNGKDFSKYKKYSLLMYPFIPVSVVVILSGGIFYIDGVTPPTLLRVAYAALYKPIFQLFIFGYIVISMFKIEDLCSSIAEWRGFAWGGRVSYSAFLLHSLFQRGLAGVQTTPLVMNDYLILIVLCASVFLSFTLGALLWLLVEAPVSEITRAVLVPRSKHTS